VNWHLDNLSYQLKDKWELILSNINGVTPISIDKPDTRGWGSKGGACIVKEG